MHAARSPTYIHMFVLCVCVLAIHFISMRFASNSLFISSLRLASSEPQSTNKILFALLFGFYGNQFLWLRLPNMPLIALPMPE